MSLSQSDIDWAVDRALQEEKSLGKVGVAANDILSWSFNQDEINQHEQEIRQTASDKFSKQFVSSKAT